MRTELLIIRDKLIKELSFLDNLDACTSAKGTLFICIADMGFKINEVERQEIFNSIYQYPYKKELDHFDLKNIKVIIRL